MARLNINERLSKNIIPEPNTGCMLWVGGSDKDGYGKIFWNKRHRRTHQVVYELKNGSIPKGHIIQHTCDTPSCCKLEHLKLGTWLSNMQDKVKKGRLRNQYMNATHCIYGHEFNDKNTKIYNGKRCCYVCISIKRNYNNSYNRP